VGSPAGRISESLSAFRSVFANPSLRYLELAWAMAVFGQSAFVVAVSIYAYGIGGADAVGLIILLRFVLAGTIAPFAGLLADRYRRESVLLGSALARIVVIGSTAAAILLDANSVIVYILAIGGTIAATPFRSAQAALTPALARTPNELTAANAVASTFESVALFGGPALAGVLLAVTRPGIVVAITVAMLAVAAVFLLRIRGPRAAPKAEMEASTLVSEAFAGFRTIGRNSQLRVLMGLLAAQTLLFGALQVCIVVLAIEALDLGNAGVGYLNSAVGVGAVAGAILAIGLTGTRRLSLAFVVGIVLIGAPLVVLGLWAQTVSALLLLGVVGIGSSVVDVAGLTLVQRAVPEDVLARVFGVIQMLFYASIALGAIVAPPLIDWLGTKGAIMVTGIFLVALTALLAPRLVRIDAEATPPKPDELRLLGRIPIFATLPGTTLEHLAGRLTPLRIEPGTVIIEEGDAGDRFYLVAEGQLDVSADGSRVSQLEAGDYFGEIALLRDLPRTATVTASTSVVLYALDREDFLAAVTGHPASAQAAEEVVGARLARFSPTGVRATTS
jgi:MFS family permease